jgi:hypothetical protein
VGEFAVFVFAVDDDAVGEPSWPVFGEAKVECFAEAGGFHLPDDI